MLAGVAAAAALTRPRWNWLPALGVAAAVRVVVSAAVFATASPTGTWIQPYDDPWPRTATILMHGFAPPLVIAAVAVVTARLCFVSWVAFSYAWPLAYLIVPISMAAVGRMAVPYPFLAPKDVGWCGVAGAIAALAALVGLVGASPPWSSAAGIASPWIVETFSGATSLP